MGAPDTDPDLCITADQEARLLRDLDDDLVAAAAIGHLDPSFRDRLTGDVVVTERDELDLHGAVVARLDVDLSARERQAQRHRAGCLEDRHERASTRGVGRRTTRTPSGRCRGGRPSTKSGSWAAPKRDG